MPTGKQIEANRLNAQKSTGPRTPDGKAAAARNSRTHGLCVTDLTLLEDPTSHDEIESLLNRYLDHYQPSDPDEEDVIEEIVTCKIRLRHLLRTENGIINEYRETAFANQNYNYKDAAGTTCYRFDRQHYPPEEHRTLDNMHLAAAWEMAQDTLVNLSRYEGRVLARYRRALDRWRRFRFFALLQAARVRQPTAITCLSFRATAGTVPARDSPVRHRIREIIYEARITIRTGDLPLRFRSGTRTTPSGSTSSRSV